MFNLFRPKKLTDEEKLNIIDKDIMVCQNTTYTELSLLKARLNELESKVDFHKQQLKLLAETVGRLNKHYKHEEKIVGLAQSQLEVTKRDYQNKMDLMENRLDILKKQREWMLKPELVSSDNRHVR